MIDCSPLRRYRKEMQNVCREKPNGADKISFRAKYTPGIAIEDISVNAVQNAGKVEINGESYDTQAQLDYVVAIYDTNYVRNTEADRHLS